MRIEDVDAAVSWAEALTHQPLDALLEQAEAMTLGSFGTTVTYSRKVFIPLTHLCRDVCHYCTFAKAPRSAGSPYLSIEQVLEIARAGGGRVPGGAVHAGGPAGGSLCGGAGGAGAVGA